jgi:hypothetical protein
MSCAAHDSALPVGSTKVLAEAGANADESEGSFMQTMQNVGSA